VGWLEALKWDGTERLTKWLTTCLGVPSTGLANAIGRKFLISAVARVMRPGSKVDHMLILEGPQGILKSTALRTLVGDDWFTDQIADLGTKDSCQDLHGKWIIELSELSAIRPGEVERVKANISRQIDYRPSYGRRSGDMPRQCAFVGTTNAKEYLSDTTGGRRFWPVLCTRIDIDRLAADRDQLWAEAVAAYHKGESWWLDNDELRRAVEGEQEDRRTQDPWESIIADWLDDPTQLDRDGIRIPLALEEGRVTNAQILEHAIAKPVERQTVADQMRVGRTLIRLGWQKRRVGRAKVMMWENTASHQEEVDTPANEPARCVHQVCPPQPRSQPSCGIPDIPDTPTRVCVTPCGQNYESGPRGVSSVSTSNGGAPDACVGNCTYCRDAVYPDDVVRAESGLLHHRCVDLWVAR
jgi:predicted P-loop ATPase